MSKVAAQSTSHTDRNSGRAEAAGQLGSLTNNFLLFQNTVRKEAQHPRVANYHGLPRRLCASAL